MEIHAVKTKPEGDKRTDSKIVTIYLTFEGYSNRFNG
jgi:hypothetical protein